MSFLPFWSSKPRPLSFAFVWRTSFGYFVMKSPCWGVPWGLGGCICSVLLTLPPPCRLGDGGGGRGSSAPQFSPTSCSIVASRWCKLSCPLGPANVRGEEGGEAACQLQRLPRPALHFLDTWLPEIKGSGVTTSFPLHPPSLVHTGWMWRPSYPLGPTDMGIGVGIGEGLDCWPGLLCTSVSPLGPWWGWGWELSSLWVTDTRVARAVTGVQPACLHCHKSCCCSVGVGSQLADPPSHYSGGTGAHHPASARWGWISAPTCPVTLRGGNQSHHLLLLGGQDGARGGGSPLMSGWSRCCQKGLLVSGCPFPGPVSWGTGVPWNFIVVPVDSPRSELLLRPVCSGSIRDLGEPHSGVPSAPRPLAAHHLLSTCWSSMLVVLLSCPGLFSCKMRTCRKGAPPSRPELKSAWGLLTWEYNVRAPVSCPLFPPLSYTHSCWVPSMRQVLH